MPKPVTVYTTDSCPHCTRAKHLLKQKGIAFKEVNITNDSETRDKLEQKTGWMTLPMIFIGEEFIGGADDLYALEESGKLRLKLNLNS